MKLDVPPKGTEHEDIGVIPGRMCPVHFPTISGDIAIHIHFVAVVAARD